MIKKIEKRDGVKANFEKSKIYNVIQKAYVANHIADAELFETLTDSVVEKLNKKTTDEKKTILSVDEVQDIVFLTIKKDNKEVAESFKSYRRNRDKARKKNQSVYKKVYEVSQVTDRDNANVGNGPSAKLLQVAESTCRDYSETFLVDDDILDAMKDNKIYPHDFSWSPTGSTTCVFIPFKKMLLAGFETGHGFERSPKRIRVAADQVAVIFQANQNDQHGGQASGWLDEELAPFVRKEFEYQLKDLKQLYAKKGIEIADDDEELVKEAWERTDKETFQAMEGLVHNLNVMHSRAGAQVPFTSTNIGTDTTPEGRMICKNLLLAYDKGLGKGEQPLFPNIIFKVKNGVNYEEGTPNHDLLKLSLEVTVNRLYPIYNFQDCTLNKDFKIDIPSMGCRTRTADDRFQDKDSLTVTGRGNDSFTTVNIVGVALETKYGDKDFAGYEDTYEKMQKALKHTIEIPKVYDKETVELLKKYFVNLDGYIDLAIRQLYERLKYQGMFRKEDFPFLMDGVWMDSENLKKGDTVADVIKHGTLAVGFCGLAECLKCLVGKHHAEDEDALALGLEIIKYFSAKVKMASEVYNLNYSLLATPAESLAGRLLNNDRAKYGVIEGVTDKDWYTNSSHCPVEFNMSVFDKVRIEGYFIKYLTGGNITYIELQESPGENIKAMFTLLKAMHDSDLALCAINFPCDRCNECGYHGLIEGDCPVCGNPSINISRIRRITGYLAEIDNFNYAKMQEALHRVKHSFQFDD